MPAIFKRRHEGELMKCRSLMCISATALLAALAIPAQLSAQDQPTKQQPTKEHHYKLIDLGTLGGPQSILGGFDGVQNINNRGTVVGVADTANSCSYHPGLVSLAFQWHSGVRTPLAVLSNGCFSVPGWINARGQIAGLSENGVIDPLTGMPEYDAVVWENDGIKNLGTFGGNFSSATAINGKGQAVGFALNTVPDPFLGPNGAFFGTQFRPFLWRNGVMHDLGTLGGPDAYAAFVNDRGQVAGYSFTNSVPSSVADACGGIGQAPTEDPFIWEDGEMTDLGTLGGTCGFANDMNSRGQVVGFSDLAGDATGHPFLATKAEGMKDLGTLGGTFGFALWVNDAGEIVGGATSQDDQAFLGFFWKNGVMTNLGTVDGDPCSQANMINSKSQIVGTSATCDFFTVQHAFIWEKGQMTDLNTVVPAGSGLQLLDALEINERGEIIGQGVIANGDQHVFLLIPCAHDHSDGEPCREDDSGATTATQNSAAPVRQNPANAVGGLTPTGIAARMRSQLGRNRIFATWPRK